MTPASKRGQASKTIPYTIPAGGQITVKATGSHLYLVESPIAVMVKLESSGATRCAPGTGLDCEDGAFFEYAEIANPAAVAIEVLVYVGFAAYKDSRQAVIEPRTRVKGANGILPINTDPLSVVDLSPVPAPGDIRRKSITVTNRDPNNSLLLLDPEGEVFQEIFPQTSIILPISEGLKLKNPNAAPVSYATGSIYWLSA